MKVDMSVTLAGIKFKNPILPASGPLVGRPDKIRKLIEQGVGGIVTKTVSTIPAPVPHPCIARYGKDGLLNCELWSEFGPEKWFDEFYPEIRRMCDEAGIPLIISLGYTGEQLEALVPKANRFADGFEISTHYVGTDESPIFEAVRAVKKHSSKPVFIKLSPHTGSFGKLAEAVKNAGGNGIAAINSLGPAFHLDIDKRRPLLGSKEGYGWLSGAPIKPLALRAVKESKEAVDLPILGVGGIFSADDAFEFMLAGAGCVQILTAALLKGVGVYGEIVRGLDKLLEKHGVKTVADIVGAALTNIPKQQNLSMEGNFPVVNHDLCVQCRSCVRSCPWDALDLSDGKIIHNRDECFACGLCATVCPTKAIELR